MGFVVTTLIFAMAGVIFSLLVRICCNKGTSANLLRLTLVVTATVCCWLMWAIVYLTQLNPLIVPILSEAVALSSVTSQELPRTDSVMAEAEEKTLVEILKENTKIDILKYVSYVMAPQCGAVATFAGTTRDTCEGKTVVELRYEAYVPMAVRCLKSICATSRSKWSLDSIAVVHRLGPVPVQETSVFVAISSVHRADALDACKYIIDELKASVPIWKKEVYSNGEIWKENSEFLERRKDDHPSNGVANSNARKGCCGTKFKVLEGVNEENAAEHSIHKNE